MIVVGLTGNIASGKSEAASIMKKLGATVVDVDLIAKSITRKGTSIYRAIVKIFGEGFLKKNRELDRRRLALHVFEHPRHLRILNILIHPGVILEVYRIIEQKKDRRGVLVLAVPLLFETRMEKLVDVTVIVKAKDSVMIARAVRRGVPRGLAEKILKSQWPSLKKEKKADFIIENNGRLAPFKKKVINVYRQLEQSF